MKLKNIIAGILFTIGFLMILGSVGQLDFDSANITDNDFLRETIKAAVGAVLCGVSVFISNISADQDN